MTDRSNQDRAALNLELDEQLRVALRHGESEQVKELIKAGANIHYKQEHNYDAVIEAVHGRDGPLLEKLQILIDHGVNLSGISSYQESGLRVLSRLGRFDGVRLLLEAGADRTQLGWTPLMEAVAIGTLPDVEAALKRGESLEARDWWSRTAWLIALAGGEIDKAKLLHQHGADTSARGRCGAPPLFHAIRGRHSRMLEWLLGIGADVHAVDDFGTTALIEAVEYDDLRCVELLLAAGAKMDVDAGGTALHRATSPEVIACLLDAGADPGEMTAYGRRVLLGLGEVKDDALATVSAVEFERAATRVFGTHNPQRMHQPFWEAMIRSGVSGYEAGKFFKQKSRTNRPPVWCAQRFGQSLTMLPDGRNVLIGGEHEDSYDPDFCIYNDVIIQERDGTLAIYGYPEQLFPPTDFHTATRLGDAIYIIGCLGYFGSRRYGQTPVFRLDLSSLQMTPLVVGGNGPGWIYEHRAAVIREREIRVWGGMVVTHNGDEELHEKNPSAFIFDMKTSLWRRE